MMVKEKDIRIKKMTEAIMKVVKGDYSVQECGTPILAVIRHTAEVERRRTHRVATRHCAWRGTLFRRITP